MSVRKLTCQWFIVVLVSTLSSFFIGCQQDRVHPKTEDLILSYQDALKSESLERVSALEEVKEVGSYEFLQKNPFLSKRFGDRILTGVERGSGKGESWASSVVMLESRGKYYRLGIHGGAEFLHFEWTPTIGTAESLIRQILGSDTWIIPQERYPSIKRTIARMYPNAIVNREDVSISRPVLHKSPDGERVRCELLVYVMDGKYYHDGTIQNSIVKYCFEIGNGFLKSTVNVLIKGPYNKDPYYWYGINNMPGPRDEEAKKRILLECAQMEDFQRLVRELVQ